MLPLYRLTPQLWQERAFYALLPIWKAWLKTQQFPKCNVVQAIMGYGTEPFDHAEKIGALKVLDCPNSHPVTYRGFWQRECDLWCPGEKVPIPQWMFGRMTRELERADLILSPSTFVRDSMVQNGIPEKKCFVNPFGVDTSVFQPRTAPPAAPRFVCVGTICLRKGHQYLFRAWEIVRRQLPDAELICVGGFKDDFRKERPKWEGTFTHVLHFPHARLAELLQSCSAFVFPSQEEGFPRAQMEALACGLPVIGTHEGGATTVVSDGVEGFIVQGRDPADIADAMIRIASDDQLNARMGRAAQSRVAHHTWQQYGDRLLEEYSSRLQQLK
jgi:glycosyltransferase involved in cell wall biosynthesis